MLVGISDIVTERPFDHIDLGQRLIHTCSCVTLQELAVQEECPLALQGTSCLIGR